MALLKDRKTHRLDDREEEREICTRRCKKRPYHIIIKLPEDKLTIMWWWRRGFKRTRCYPTLAAALMGWRSGWFERNVWQRIHDSNFRISLVNVDTKEDLTHLLITVDTPAHWLPGQIKILTKTEAQSE